MNDQPLTPGILVALPALKDSYFGKTVILLCDYAKEGAFGLVINRPSELEVLDILENKIELPEGNHEPIMLGGPVQPEFLWALHTPDFLGQSTTQLTSNLCMSSLQEVLAAIMLQQGPRHYKLGCGYAGWGAGQLDTEIKDGAWWLSEMDEQLVMTRKTEQCWETALGSLGLDPISGNFMQFGES